MQVVFPQRESRDQDDETGSLGEMRSSAGNVGNFFFFSFPSRKACEKEDESFSVLFIFNF